MVSALCEAVPRGSGRLSARVAQLYASVRQAARWRTRIPAWHTPVDMHEIREAKSNFTTSTRFWSS